MTSTSVDVVVIGMGPGGETLAGQLAEAGLSVVGADARLVGGEPPRHRRRPRPAVLITGRSRELPWLAAPPLFDVDGLVHAPLLVR
ncbi:MAG: hypothetical protein GEV28_23430 [Actinophytocola sp.]|uniref:hypothetical protein n=1 Tax=Actinophytocola sp. TaxID=1872138 RepID=UPI00132A6B26|nr:hypothetical protein [Actinophytocola sp.]MPZ83183.1 hypothetical protein [Actinophytocola sp.]